MPAKPAPKKHAAALGLGLAALAAAAAGAYYFYGKDGARHRKHLKSWALKAKAEAMEKVEKLKEVTEPAYRGAITQVLDKYKKVKSIDPKELELLGKELHSHWKRIAAHLKTQPKKSRKK